MRAGLLCRRIQIQSATETNANGQVSRTWATDATVWGSVDPLSGRELYYAQQISAEAKYKAVIRHRSGVTAENRLVVVEYDSDTEESTVVLTLNIVHVANAAMRNSRLEILCTEAEA